MKKKPFQTFPDKNAALFTLDSLTTTYCPYTQVYFKYSHFLWMFRNIILYFCYNSNVIFTMKKHFSIVFLHIWLNLLTQVLFHIMLPVRVLKRSGYGYYSPIRIGFWKKKIWFWYEILDQNHWIRLSDIRIQTKMSGLLDQDSLEYVSFII